MEGRNPSGIITVFYDCANHANFKELDRWCDQVCVPALMATGVFSAVSRWANVSAQAESGEPQYVIILETQGDVMVARSRFHERWREWQRQGKIAPLMGSMKVMSFQRVCGPISREAAAQSPARKEPWVSWAAFAEKHYPGLVKSSSSR